MRSNQINFWWVKYFQKEKSSSILWYSWKRMAPDMMEGRAMKSGQFVRYFCPFTAAKSSHLLLCFSLEDWSPPWLQWLCLCGDGKHKSNSYHVCTPRCHSMWSPIHVHAIKINYVFLFLYWSIGMVPKSHPGEKMWQQRWVDPGTDHVCMSDVAPFLLCRAVLCVNLNLHHFPVYREGNTNRSVFVQCVKLLLFRYLLATGVDHRTRVRKSSQSSLLGLCKE